MRRLTPAQSHGIALARLLVQAARCGDIAARIELTAASEFMPASANELALVARDIRTAGTALARFVALEEDKDEETSE
jgi:hypothetical protein